MSIGLGESIFALSHLGSHIHRFQGFIYFSRFISERFLYVSACMCICLVIALPLEATDGPCLLSSQGCRQYGVVQIHGTPLQGLCLLLYTCHHSSHRFKQSRLTEL